jgi:hypothetical protein
MGFLVSISFMAMHDRKFDGFSDGVFSALKLVPNTNRKIAKNANKHTNR